MKQSSTDFNLNFAIKQLKLGAILIDARSYPEFCQGHLTGATLIPAQSPPLTTREQTNLQDQLQYYLKKQSVSKNHPIIVYCKKGIRATTVKQTLLKLGYKNVTVLGGVDVAPLKSLFHSKSPIWPICYCN